MTKTDVFPGKLYNQLIKFVRKYLFKTQYKYPSRQLDGQS